MSANRRYHLIVLGATGFTGRLITQYIHQHALVPSNASWAIAGRSQVKLNALRDILALREQHRKDDTELSPLPMVEVVEAKDDARLLSLAASTRVLLSCVGPFIVHGEPVVRACTVAKTHYVDITGEPMFLDLVRSRYAPTAEQQGTCLMPAAGFDSVPCDVAVYHHLQTLGVPEGSPLPDDLHMRGYVKMAGGGGLSKGTFSTMLESLSRDKVPFWKTVLTRSSWPIWSEDLHAWTLPFPSSDPWVANYQLQQRFPSAITWSSSSKVKPRYEHFLVQKSFLTAMLISLALLMLRLIALVGPIRRFVVGLRDDGSGPVEESRKQGAFSIHVVSSSSVAPKLHTAVRGVSGYDTTAVCASHAARLLAEKEPAQGPKGLNSPMAGLGAPYLQTLQQAGALQLSVVAQLRSTRMTASVIHKKD